MRRKKPLVQKLEGLTVRAVKGNVGLVDARKKYKDVQMDYILFDDGRTYIEFEDRDYYTYHDCDNLARTYQIYQDKAEWNAIMTRENFKTATYLDY